MWGSLPYDLFRHIANFADIDTRRAMGFKPRKLSLIHLDPKPMPSTEFRYYINAKKLWYFEMTEYANFFFEIHTNVELDDPQIPRFRFGPNARHIIVTYTEGVSGWGDHLIKDDHPFQTADFPIWII